LRPWRLLGNSLAFAVVVSLCERQRAERLSNGLNDPPMMTGTVDIIKSGSEFERAKGLLVAKYQEGESVIVCFKPAKSVTCDYVTGELKEPH
jgi:hypothetical protein